MMEEDLKRAAEILKAGGVILYPTDTVWGLGCDATNAEAIERIFKIKHRADSKSMIVLLGSENLLERYVEEVPEIAYQLIEVADKPLTIVYSDARNLAPGVVADDGSAAIRVTRDEYCRRLCNMIRRPLVSTSANISGQPTAASFCDISDEVADAVDYISEWRRAETITSRPSTIIKLDTDGTFKILRK